jgi:hypothetical protein
LATSGGLFYDGPLQATLKTAAEDFSFSQALAGKQPARAQQHKPQRSPSALRGIGFQRQQDQHKDEECHAQHISLPSGILYLDCSCSCGRAIGQIRAQDNRPDEHKQDRRHRGNHGKRRDHAD